MNNTNNIESFFKLHFPFNQEGINELLQSFKVKLYKKGDVILKPGKIDRELKFINSGFVREYYATESKEININFFGEMEFSTDINSFHNETETKKWQACITDVEMRILSKKKFDALLEKYPCGHGVISKSMQNFIKAKDNLEFDRTTKDPETLYNDMHVKKSNWLKHIPQYHIASYLNVTPETLSRIRKRIS